MKIYGFTSEVIEHGITFSFKEMGLLVDTLYCGVLLFIFCDCSDKASANIAERVQTSLLNIRVDTVDVDTMREVSVVYLALLFFVLVICNRNIRSVCEVVLKASGLLHVH